MPTRSLSPPNPQARPRFKPYVTSTDYTGASVHADERRTAKREDSNQRGRYSWRSAVVDENDEPLMFEVRETGASNRRKRDSKSSKKARLDKEEREKRRAL